MQAPRSHSMPCSPFLNFLWAVSIGGAHCRLFLLASICALFACWQWRNNGARDFEIPLAQHKICRNASDNLCLAMLFATSVSLCVALRCQAKSQQFRFCSPGSAPWQFLRRIPAQSTIANACC